MSTSTIEQLPKATAKLTIRIPWNDVKGSYDEVFDEVVKTVELPGFRRGKAPKDMVEKSVDRSKLYQEVIKRIIPKAFADSVKQHTITPVTSPKIDVKKAKEGEEWEVEATVALRPTMKLGNYKEKVRMAKKPKAEIWTPGKDIKKDEKQEKAVPLDVIMEALLSEITIEMSDLLIQDEVNRMLSELIDQTKRLGMTVEQYLIAKGKTTELLQKEYHDQAAKTLTIQFALAEIADKENISVTQKDLDELIAKAEKPEERERLKKDSYYLAHLIRQQKTIDFLQNL